MNRLVIIGNGFDLAHGLPTSYRDFIDDYWKNVIEEIKNQKVYKDDLYSLKLNLSGIGEQRRDDFNNDVVCYQTLQHFTELYKEYCTKKIINGFFMHLTDLVITENWVDVENEYYRKLKIIVKNTSLSKADKMEQTIILNKEFEQVKNLLEKYLKEKVVEKYHFSISGTNEINKFNNIFYPDILQPNKIASWKETFSKDDKEYINELIKVGKDKDVKVRFLNFNYTPTLRSYFCMNSDFYFDSEFFIHGKLGDENNKINFGFGDEMDDDYKMIENIDENEYLKHFKSFQYFQNDTYKKLLDFVESEKFEVYIMGSSCGLSDRTLLNTIFENINCRSIKVFYYQKMDGNDNFTELTQNISRHFKDKTLMRSKIVHKSPNHIMPKIQLPLK